MKKRLLAFLSFVVIAVSCGKTEAEKEAEKIKSKPLVTIQQVNTISALGKIEPEKELINLAVDKGGIVKVVYKKAGDQVKNGDIILEFDNNDDVADENIIARQIKVQYSQADADAALIKKYEAQLTEKEKDLLTTETLAKTGADTRQNVLIKTREREVIEAQLANAKANVTTSQKRVLELQAQLSKSKELANDKVIRSKQNGLLVTIDAKPGNALNPFSVFATLAPIGNLVVHGEVDEMFANKIQIGQKITIRDPGTNDILSEGEIVFISPILENKSLFYETPGELSDRRVRKFKADLLNQQSLLINSKVECIIHVK